MAETNYSPHLEWLGFVQPQGLVVSAAALDAAGVIPIQNDIEGQNLLRTCLQERPAGDGHEAGCFLPDFPEFARRVLGWSFAASFFAGTAERPLPPELSLPLPDFHLTLRPDFAVAERAPDSHTAPWQLLVQVLPTGQSPDDVPPGSGTFEVTAHGRMERLLRHTGVTAGLLFNGCLVRLLSAPRGESSGWLDFPVAAMAETAGRPILAAMRMLLRQERLLTGAAETRLTALLRRSREFQNKVSERLADQVVHALYEFVRGFQAAHEAAHGTLLAKPLAEHPDEVYRALLTVILRLVFLLYAEERGMLPGDETFSRHYSLGGLYKRLREEAALHPDTMDQRFGAWGQLLVLFRMLHSGALCGNESLPQRHGDLFDPERFPFLEGREAAAVPGLRIEPPLVPDGSIQRILEKLLVLDGERISYRALDVEEIGSVYQALMGFRLETAGGRSLAVKAGKRWSAPTTIDLDALLAEPPVKRKKWFEERTDRTLGEKTAKAVKAATTIDELHEALDRLIDKEATPDRVPRGAMVLQPSAERRRSGSHYTPRSLTEPIVRTTLEPVWARLGGPEGRAPRPEQILELRICDPAMGSGAFLVEACRQMADRLIEAWEAHGGRPTLPPDEDELVFARRLVAQRCIYGVDRNPVAVDLAKVSLWLATLARDHAFTFLDHALRHGDSLLGLPLQQIEGLQWDPARPASVLKGLDIREPLERIRRLRQRIREADERVTDAEIRARWREAEDELRQVRLLGDVVLSSFFAAEKPGERETRRLEYVQILLRGEADAFRAAVAARRSADPPFVPFHWELEFPEVFARENPGFDAVVGNPPFAGKNTLAKANVGHYPDWLKTIHPESHGNADLVAHFFRRAFSLLRRHGAFGLIATNTIAQGDTRSTGLRWICRNRGEIIAARKRVRWPGLAAVVVSVVHVCKGVFGGTRLLDGRPVDTITAFLFHAGGHDDPARLSANADRSFQGSIVLGMGFTFDDTDKKGVATPLAEMRRLIEENPRNREVIFPYIGGEEVNSSPTHAHHRYVINFGVRSEAECREKWPELMAIVEEKVKPERTKNKRDVRKKYWWRFGETTPALFEALEDDSIQKVLAISRVTEHPSFAFLPKHMVFSERLIVFSQFTYSFFCTLQSRIHEIWVRVFSSTLKDDLMYAPSDCFETFPFPEKWEERPELEAAGREYYEFRAGLMVQHQQGLTQIYNRFHDPGERDAGILRLRELHAAMDRAVLTAYGWPDIPTACEFLLDYEDDEEEEGKRRKPWRLRWPDEVRDEVLIRLLALNAARARAEAHTPAPPAPPPR